MSIPRRSNFSAQEPINNLHDFLWFDSLTQLLVSSNDVASLDGAEPLLKNILMEGLSLPYNRISELPVIQTCLCRSLDLSGNQIADVSPLKDLAVHTLALADNLIEDGEPFAGARFASLDLSGNPMTRFALSLSLIHICFLPSLTVWRINAAKTAAAAGSPIWASSPRAAGSPPG